MHTVVLESILVIWLLVNTVIALIVSSHASNRGKSGYFWLVFFFGIIGVLLYVADMAGSGNEDSNTRESPPSRRAQGSKSIKEEGEETSLSAVYDELRTVGQADAEHFIEHIYPIYPAGYESGKEWWHEFISDELASFAGVESPTEEGEAWIHRPTIERRGASTSNENESSTDSWQTHPNTDLMHREIGNRARGLYVEVSDGETQGKFFVDEAVRAESPRLKSENGEQWVAEARSYLQGVY